MIKLLTTYLEIVSKRGEKMTDQSIWSEMSYHKYKNPTNLKERLDMEEEDIFDIYDEEKDKESVTD